MPLKNLSNFWRLLEMPLINCKVELKLKWSKYCVLSGDSTENVINEGDNANNIIFTVFTSLFLSHKIICSFCNFISKRQ